MPFYSLFSLERQNVLLRWRDEHREEHPVQEGVQLLAHRPLSKGYVLGSPKSLQSAPGNIFLFFGTDIS